MHNQDPIVNKPYTVYRGAAAEDIEKNSTILLVICPELMPNAPFGVVGSGITEETISLQTRSGKPLTSKVTSANHLVATWAGDNAHRYPPMIRKGEPVEVYRTEGQDKYTWRPTGQGRDFRTTDRVHIEIGATDPSKPGVTKDDTNTYSVYLDSDAKKVGLKTSKANGEAAAFSMEADLEAGTFHISDDSKDSANRIFLDTGQKSGVPTFQVNLVSGVTLKFENDDVFLKVPGKFLVDIGDRVVINSPLSILNLDKKGTVIVNAASIALNSAKGIILSAGSVIGLNAASTKITGVLVSASARIASAVKGAFGGDGYKPSSVSRPLESPVNDTDNSPDTNMVGPPYRST